MDNTEMIARSFAMQRMGSISWRIIQEEEPGLSAARKRGIEEASYAYTLFCDDDNLLDSRYLSIVWQVMQADPNIGAVGGCGVLETDGMIPDWFARYESAYACGPQAETNGYITKTRGYLYGAGLCFQTELVRRILREQKLVLTDRIGSRIVSGGDSEICLLIVLAGYELYYHDALRFKHLISSNRLTLSYLHRLFESFGASYIRLHTLQRYAQIQSNQYKALRSIWLQRIRQDFSQILRYLIRGPRTTATVAAAWTWGLTKAYIRTSKHSD